MSPRSSFDFVLCFTTFLDVFFEAKSSKVQCFRAQIVESTVFHHVFEALQRPRGPRIPVVQNERERTKTNGKPTKTNVSARKVGLHGGT